MPEVTIHQISAFPLEDITVERELGSSHLSMASLDTYHVWNVYVPAALSALLWLLTFVLMLVFIPLLSKVPRIYVEVLQLSLSDVACENKDDFSTSTASSCPKSRSMDSDISYSMPKAVEFTDSSCDEVEIDGETVNTKAVKILAVLVIPLTVATIFFSFWNIWLVEEETGTTCLPNFDCFPMLGGRVLQDTPVETCSEYLDVSVLADLLNDTSLVMNKTLGTADLLNETTLDLNDTQSLAKVAANAISYKCYRFVFLYAEGIGAAGGILFFTAVFSKLYFCILMAIVGSGRYNKLRLGVLISVWIIAAVVWVLFIVVNTAVPVIREAVFRTDTDIIQFFLYTVNFGAVVVGGCVVSLGVIHK